MPNAALILGYGVTGKALAEYFHVAQHPYYILEDGDIVLPTSPFCRGRVDGQNMPAEVNAIFPSPGVPTTHPALLWAAEHNVPLVSELDFAATLLCAQPHFIGVTGTNGKSTTVKLIHALLTRAGMSTGLFGNIGSPLINALQEVRKDYYVIEESSYQLEQIQTLHHQFAVCLNVTDDHFDRHMNLRDYARVKALLLKNSTAADHFIYNHDDHECFLMSQKTSAQRLPFSLVATFETGGFVDKSDLVIAFAEHAGGRQFRFPIAECTLKGLHNLENMLAALLVVLKISHTDQAVAAYRQTLGDFVALPHRVEKVATLNQVDYYDDSKGTNVGAVVMALASFEGPVILIAGGKDKMGDYTPLKGLVKGKVKTLILLGEAKDKMAMVFQDDTQVEKVANMREAVALAKKIAVPGDTVLLSPACSSFDQYKNYHERGLDFQDCVRSQ